MVEKIELSEAESSAVKDRFELWEQLKEYYSKAEDLKAVGETQITVLIDVLLLARDIPKNVEKFYSQLFRAAAAYRPKKDS